MKYFVHLYGHLPFHSCLGHIALQGISATYIMVELNYKLWQSNLDRGWGTWVFHP